MSLEAGRGHRGVKLHIGEHWGGRWIHRGLRMVQVVRTVQRLLLLTQSHVSISFQIDT